MTTVTLGPVGLRPVLTGDAGLDRFVAFLFAGFILGLVDPLRRTCTALCLIVLAALLEAGQLVVPGRSASLLDASIKAGGGAIGVAVAFAVWPVRPSARRNTFARAGATAAVVLAVLGSALWWVRAPVLAVREARLAMLAGANAAGFIQPPAIPLRAIIAAHPAPIIDIWGRGPDRFQATLRDGDLAFVVMQFKRDGFCWRLVSVRHPRGSRPNTPSEGLRSGRANSWQSPLVTSAQ